MSVGIVVVTHGRSGAALIGEAEFVLGNRMEEFGFVNFDHSADRERQVEDIRKALERVSEGDGVLVLTDLPGASPSNIAAEMLEEFDGVMVTGLNLAMLICVWNYRDRSLGLLVRKAVEGGRRGVKIFQK